MAAPTRLRACVNVLHQTCKDVQYSRYFLRTSKTTQHAPPYPRFQSTSHGYRQNTRKRTWSIFTRASMFTLGSAVIGFEGWKVYAGGKVKPDLTPSRRIHMDTDTSGLKLTLFQYQTCPFCCKVRAFLDYHGFSYNIVEVNSITKKQLKWSDYKKVPLLVLDGVGEDDFLALRDSCVIVSLLESFMGNKLQKLDQLHSYYPCIESKEGRKTVYDFPNKYFIMYMDRSIDTTPEERKEERQWRNWADSNLVHMLSPNVYRTRSEALQAFHYFSDVGEWEKNFSGMERQIVIYLGATVMYFIGKMLKNKYKLKDDVRESLYDSCREWTKALSKKKQQFMGGDSPNLADLAVYGVLSSIEGCEAFQDALSNTNIGPWYRRTKVAVNSHAGANPLNKKS
ncbi:prostaglandin E synthase 2-like [Haliotis rufescens]|uniref:prostaglandin E synthase 2-like n=1 Tax=Haliotis rufescens TaxID=6454 RepID=UPI00201E874E|nr:prostaglandin E synthase 2-like [Haliotis rufescens]XP_046370271.2 prostaglandin E synthase 2-like [Haliotis rufescens]